VRPDELHLGFSFCRTVTVPNAIRLVDIPEALAQVLRRYTEGKDGYLFTTRAGRLLDQRNSLKALQWMGHSQNLMDLYAAQLRLDIAYRREWCDRAGLGFELGELGYKSLAPIRPLLVA
jgi:hypothetical protein